MLNVTCFFYSYATLQPLQTRNLSQREAYEQQRMQSMQKAEHDRRKFYQDENNEGYPPQSGHHLQQPQAYHHSPYHQHPLRNNNQVHIFFIKLCIKFFRYEYNKVVQYWVIKLVLVWLDLSSMSNRQS